VRRLRPVCRENYHETIALSRDASGSARSIFVGAYLDWGCGCGGMAGRAEVSSAALHELAAPAAYLAIAWIANHLPWQLDSDREH